MLSESKKDPLSQTEFLGSGVVSTERIECADSFSDCSHERGRERGRKASVCDGASLSVLLIPSRGIGLCKESCNHKGFRQSRKGSALNRVFLGSCSWNQRFVTEVNSFFLSFLRKTLCPSLFRYAVRNRVERETPSVL